MKVFQENQKFTQLWLWIILLGINGLFAYGLYQQLVLEKNFGTNSMSNLGMIIAASLMVLLTVFFYNLELRTYIDRLQIHIHFFPLFKRTYKWEDIESAEVVKRLVLGYGIRFSPEGTVFNVKGNRLLKLTFRDGKTLLIGTQKPEALITFLKGMRPKNH
ncbi:hypothetical protein [Ascidiimonas aurantiaca]|uniref:hypothetical protein n=1 Tax=Ascidiimonas aurantiaca TaxID=1685432 RepID=UPI0030EB4980